MSEGLEGLHRPPVPQGLRASIPVWTSQPTVVLLWDRDAAANRFGVHRNGTLLKIVTTDSYTDTNVVPGQTYTYGVDARNSAGTSAQSSPVTIKVPANILPPPVPSGLASSNVTSSSATLTWQPSSGATGYIVHVNGSALPEQAATSLNLVGLSPSTTYSVTVLALNSAGSSAQSTPISLTTTAAGTRNPLLWPFLSTAYPNMPIGSGAVRVKANLILSTIQSLHSDTSIVLMDPTQPPTKILPNGGFQSDHCAATSQTPLATVPMAAAFVVPNAGHNYSTAAVNQDGKTYIQGGSFCRATAGGNANLEPSFHPGNLYGDALGPGGRGGTGMDSLAGNIRIGELRPGSGPIRHAIAIDIDNLDNSINAFTWPATKKDSYNYKGSNKYAIPGALFALPVDFPVASLQTEPGRILAQAFIDHGGYCGNDVKGPSIGICTELSPAGNFQTQFQSDWGTPFAGSSGPWIADVTAIFSNLDVIINNSPSTIGGGGTPLVPLAPPLS